MRMQVRQVVLVDWQRAGGFRKERRPIRQEFTKGPNPRFFREPVG